MSSLCVVFIEGLFELRGGSNSPAEPPIPALPLCVVFIKELFELRGGFNSSTPAPPPILILSCSQDVNKTLRKPIAEIIKSNRFVFIVNLIVVHTKFLINMMQRKSIYLLSYNLKISLTSKKEIIRKKRDIVKVLLKILFRTSVGSCPQCNIRTQKTQEKQILTRLCFL